MSVPRVSKAPARAEAPPRTGAAMAVIMTGVLMTAVDTTMVLAAVLSALRAGSAGRRG